jgi:pimeloyl-ACP methyl ester carboxylesterase
MPPADYRVNLTRPEDESTNHCSHFEMPGPVLKSSFEPTHDGTLPAAVYREYVAGIKAMPHPAPKATIVLLHGFGLNKYAMMPWAFVLGEAGYRTVLIDLRGHGASTGRFTTYGIVESRDIEQVIDWLQKRRLIAGPLAVLGDSLGAAVAIDTAARDPRIKAVVALQPFARADDVIKNFAPIAHPFLSMFVSDSSIASGELKAGKLAGVDLTKAAPIDVVGQVTAPVLFIYGTADRVTPPATARAFERAAPDGRLITLQGYDHFALAVGLGATAPKVLEWLAPLLGGGTPKLVHARKTADAHASKAKAVTHLGLDLSFCVAP